MTAIREALQELIHCMDLSAAGQPVYERWKHAVSNARAALSQEVPQPDDETTWTADYRAGYEAAVAACCALGWKTPQEVPQEPVADPKARAIKINSVIQAAWAHDASALALALQSEPATQAEIEAFPDYPPSQVKVAAQEPPPRDPQQEVDLLLGRAAAPSGELPPLELARKFHEAYERLAPLYGYETRQETREFDPTSNNGRLMIAVCAEVRAYAKAARGASPLTDEQIAPFVAIASEYESRMAQWREARAGTQEIADLHASFKALERRLIALAESGALGVIARAIEAARGEK